MGQPQVNIGTVANVFVRQMHFISTGDEELGHKHPYDHLTLLAKGSLRVRVDEQDTVFVAPHMIYIKAEKEHQLTAETDNTVAYCIHPLRETTGDIVDPSMVPKGVELLDMLSRFTIKDA